MWRGGAGIANRAGGQTLGMQVQEERAYGAEGWVLGELGGGGGCGVDRQTDR